MGLEDCSLENLHWCLQPEYATCYFLISRPTCCFFSPNFQAHMLLAHIQCSLYLHCVHACLFLPLDLNFSLLLSFFFFLAYVPHLVYSELTSGSKFRDHSWKGLGNQKQTLLAECKANVLSTKLSLQPLDSYFFTGKVHYILKL